MDQYDVEQRLGGGDFGDVYVVLHKTERTLYAMKKINLGPNLELSPAIFREGILFDTNHENVIRLKEAFIHEHYICFVMELMSTSLALHLTFHEHEYPEIIPSFLKQILSGLAYCHSRGIMHRDIFPCNLLVDISRSVIKLADFGLSRGFVGVHEGFSPTACTIPYKAPEVLLGSSSYSAAVDIWSVGCVFAEMVAKKTLFQGTSDSAVVQDIFRKMGTPNEVIWPGVSDLPGWQTDFLSCIAMDLAELVPGLAPTGLDLLSGLLCFDPANRISAQDALMHEYLSRP